MVSTEKSPAKTRNVIAVLVKVYSALFIIALISTVISLLSVNNLLANAARVDGEVVKLTSDSKGRRAPIVRFKTADGQMFESKSTLYTSPAPSLGDKVKVLYRISNPRDARIDDWIHLYFWTLMGAIFMLAWAIAITATMLIGRYRLFKPTF